MYELLMNCCFSFMHNISNNHNICNNNTNVPFFLMTDLVHSHFACASSTNINRKSTLDKYNYVSNSTIFLKNCDIYVRMKPLSLF